MIKAAYRGNEISYTYDSEDRLSTVTLPNGIVKTMTYENETGNALKQIKYEKDSDVLYQVDFEYDDEGKLQTKRASGDSFIENTYRYLYDSESRVVGVYAPPIRGVSTMAKYKGKLIFILAICLSVLLSLTIIVNGKKWFRDFCVWYIGSYCHYYSFSDFCFSPDGNMIGTVNSSTMQPVIWDWKNKPSPYVFAIMPSDMSFSDDGRYFVAGNFIKKEIVLYDLSKKEIIFTHRGIRPCFSADSKKIVFFDKEESSKITIWDIENKSQVSKFEIGTITSIEQHLKPLKNDMGRSLIVFNFSRNFARIDICDIKDWKSLLLKLKAQKSPEIKLIRDNLDRKSQTVITDIPH